MKRTLITLVFATLPLLGLWPLAQIGGGIFGKPKLSTLAVIDFADVGNDCEDSAAVSLIGAAQGDLCKIALVGNLSTAGAAGFDKGIYTCFVSTANNVIVRHCDPGLAGQDPASATWAIEVTKR